MSAHVGYSSSPSSRDQDEWQRTKRRRTHSPRTSHSREYGLMREGADHGRPRFLGSSSGIYFIRTVYDALARRPGGARNQSSPQDDLIPGEDDQLQEQSRVGTSDKSLSSNINASFWHSSEILPQDASPIPLQSFDEMVQWSRSYFENWHPLFPFLHAPTVLRHFEHISLSCINDLAPAQAVVVRSIISISLADARQSAVPIAGVPSELVFRDSKHMVSQIQFALFEPASLHNLQALLAAQLFLVSLLRLNFASRLGGLILRMAFHLGLHRCPARYPNFNDEEAQLRQRVFWCIYCIERMLCQSLGLPLDIQDDDVDVCYLGNELHPLPSRVQNQGSANSSTSALAIHGNLLTSSESWCRPKFTASYILGQACKDSWDGSRTAE